MTGWARGGRGGRAGSGGRSPGEAWRNNARRAGARPSGPAGRPRAPPAPSLSHGRTAVAPTATERCRGGPRTGGAGTIAVRESALHRHGLPTGGPAMIENGVIFAARMRPARQAAYNTTISRVAAPQLSCRRQADLCHGLCLLWPGQLSARGTVSPQGAGVKLRQRFKIKKIK